MHGLTYFQAQQLIDKAKGALTLLETTAGGDGEMEAAQEAMRVVLENQVLIAETLEKIKAEFDKFEEGLGKIL